jgi:adenylate cyclase
MGIEIERKFLVNRSMWVSLEKPAGLLYRQGYLAEDEKKVIRVRATPVKGFITIKSADPGLSRSEFEYEIPLEEAVYLLDNFSISEISKIRHFISVSNKTWEVDVFSGENDGLIVAEIELTDENEDFLYPEWIGAEVSHDKRYSNASLARNPYNSWAN